MDDNGIFEIANLENIRESRIPNILVNSNELGNRKNKLSPAKTKKFVNIGDICDNTKFSLVINFIQSLISLGYFYLFYIYEFTFNDTTIFVIVEISLFFILIMFIIIINYLCNDELFRKNIYNKKYNYATFILINIYKIIFEIFIYLLITLDKKHNQLDFQHFETRAYWKISISFFYIILVIYYYFSKKGDNTEKKEILIVVSFTFICIIIFVLLLFLTDRRKTNLDRFYYLFALAIELFLSTISFLQNKIEQETNHNIFQVNTFDFFKSGICLFIMIIDCIVEIGKCLCKKIINNYR